MNDPTQGFTHQLLLDVHQSFLKAYVSLEECASVCKRLCLNRRLHLQQVKSHTGMQGQTHATAGKCGGGRTCT